MARDYMAESALLRKIAGGLDVYTDPTGARRPFDHALDEIVLDAAEDALLDRVFREREW